MLPEGIDGVAGSTHSHALSCLYDRSCPRVGGLAAKPMRCRGAMFAVSVICLAAV